MNEDIKRVVAVLTEHDGHTISVGGAWATDSRTLSVSGDVESLAMNYLGFAVHCFTCGTSLSQQWL